MPARKNRPNKFGTTVKTPEFSYALVRFLQIEERKNPSAFHYVPSDMVHEADKMTKAGYLKESVRARGEYQITHEFWMKFLAPTRG